MRILTVEDEPSLLRTIAKTLREEGYAVDQAADGEEGLSKAREVDYDLIVLDVMLPRLVFAANGRWKKKRKAEGGKAETGRYKADVAGPICVAGGCHRSFDEKEIWRFHLCSQVSVVPRGTHAAQHAGAPTDKSVG